MNDFLSRVFSPLSLILWLVVSAVSAVAGPFGTYAALSLPQRAVYWGVLVGLSVLLGRAARIGLDTWLPDRPAAQRDVILLMGIVPLLSLLIVVLAPLLPGGAAMPVPSGWRVSGYVLAIGLIILGFRRAVTITPVMEEAPETPLPRLSERLPQEMQGPILRLSAMDHHVEVATARGVFSLRMRLADAVREMDPVEGCWTHRSHWVTRRAIDRVEKQGAAKLWLVLVNGDRVPVSRKHRPDLEAAGIVEADQGVSG